MSRRLLLIGLLALVLAAPAAAQPRVLWPGVTFDTQLQFTPNGPVAINVLLGPRPGGTTTLEPALSNETLLGRETLTAMQQRLSASATTAGVNADLFSLQTGLPSGVLLRQTELLHPPHAARSSAGLLGDGTLEVRRVSFFATWQGAGPKRTLNELNAPAPPGGSALYTQAYGPATPAYTDAAAVVMFPFPAAVPGVDLPAPVVEARGGGPVPIPPGGAVLVARGTAAAALQAEAPAGSTLTARFVFRPDWPGLVTAVGGGPQIVRDGAPVFRAGEAFTSSQLGPRAPRSAIGQLRDGRVVLVAVDGRQPGYSVGLSNFELAQALVRLGAVTGMALDGGGSTTMALDGSLLNRPSGGTERPISTALLFSYSGVYVQPPLPVVSPDGDGVGDAQTLRYKLVRPATVTVTLRAPNRSVAFTETAERAPGLVDVPFPPVSTQGAGAATPLDGRWTLAVRAVDDLGRETTMAQSFKVNTTLGFLRAPARLFLPPGGRDAPITWRQGRSARVTVTIVDREGSAVRTLALRRYRPGEQGVVWNGLDRTRQRVKGGVYTARVVARNALGTSELTAPIRVRQIAGPGRPPQ